MTVLKFSSEFNLGFERLLNSHSGHEFKGCPASASLILNALCSLAEQAYKDLEPGRRYGSGGADQLAISTDDLWDLPLTVSVPKLAALIYPEGADSTTSRNCVLTNLHRLCSLTDGEGTPLLLKASFTKGHDCVLRLQKTALELYFGVRNFCFLPRELFNLSAFGAQAKLSYQQRLAFFALFEEGRARLVKSSYDFNCEEMLFTAGAKVFAVAKTAVNKIKRILKALCSAQLICESLLPGGRLYTFNSLLQGLLYSLSERAAVSYQNRVDRNNARRKGYRKDTAQKGRMQAQQTGVPQCPRGPVAQIPAFR